MQRKMKGKVALLAYWVHEMVSCRFAKPHFAKPHFAKPHFASVELSSLASLELWLRVHRLQALRGEGALTGEWVMDPRRSIWTEEQGHGADPRERRLRGGAVGPVPSSRTARSAASSR